VEVGSGKGGVGKSTVSANVALALVQSGAKVGLMDADIYGPSIPPGTGDIQLSLCQKVPLTGALVVSTPQDVALNVAKKAILMFNQLNTPILGIVENMSYHLCPHCGERDEIFGTGGGSRLSQEMNIPFLGEIPLSTNIREYSDQGKPVVLADADSEQAKVFIQVAESLAAQISIRAMSGAFEQDIKVSF